MKSVSKISRGQLLALLIAGRLSGCLLFSSDSFENFSFWDCLGATFLNGLLLLLLLLPTVWVLRKGDDGVCERAYRFSKAAGKTADILYLPLCLFVMGLDIVQFSDFAAKTMKEEFSLSVLTVVFIVFCLLAALYGIQAVARASTVVAVFSVLCLAVFTIALIPEMKGLHFPPQSAGAVSRVWEKALSDLPRTAEVTAIGLLYPYVNGPRLGPCMGFAGLTAFFSAAVSLTAVAVLGDFSALSFYPYYTAVSAAQMGIFQRLDILVTAVWLGTFFIRFTLFFMLLLDRSRSAFGKKATVPTAAVTFVLLTAAAFLIQSGSYSGEWHMATQLYWWALGLFCLVIPVLIFAGGLKREKR